MIITKQSGALDYLAAEGISAPHAFTTRLGGVSTGHLSSMNIGTSRGDDPENVLKNYGILGNALGFDVHDLVLSRQTHSDIVRAVDGGCAGAGLFKAPLPECDGLITNTPGLALVVFTADCTPILFHDPVTGAVGAAHAGWRGTASAIAARTVEAMEREYGARPENIHAAIGPNIGPCHFACDRDVPDAMLRAFGEEVRPWLRQEGSKYFPDLKAINGWILQKAGVTHIEISDACTLCQPQRFWSHRITGASRGSQGAVIVREEHP